MFNSLEKYLLMLLTVFLVVAVAIGKNPWASACVLFIASIKILADKYFHDSFHDENKLTISQLKETVAKLKAKQDSQDLRTAFGGNKQ